jgi:hypothetical protein
LPPEHGTENTARIARTVRNLAVSGAFLRAVVCPADGRVATVLAITARLSTA